MNQIPTYDQLSEILRSQASPEDKGWSIYRYLKENLGNNISSQDARALLHEYIKLPVEHPSLLHTLILGTALKMVEIYPDFKLLGFLNVWGLENLRPDDYKRRADDKGHTFYSMAERLAISVLRYSVAHPEEIVSELAMDIAKKEGGKLGFLTPVSMAAVKIFESQAHGRKVRMVKLVGADGSELTSDWRMFHSKPWEIVGHTYNILARRSEKSGKVRVDTIGQAKESAADVFGRVIGYVDRYDDNHRQYHIFDNLSRHFVAESPTVRISVGDFVWFAPIIPSEDKFKTAIVLDKADRTIGRESFGMVQASVVRVNTEKGYFMYETDAGERAFCNITLVDHTLNEGERLNLIVYQRRGRDGEKRPYVAEAFSAK